MRVRVRYLGGSRTQTRCSEEIVEITDSASVRDLRDVIAKRHPKLSKLLQQIRWARNHEFVGLSVELADGDEVALLPPVCGGAARALTTEQPLNINSVRELVARESHGATVLFVGTVRNQTHGNQVTSLRYEAYEPMASKQLEHIIDNASANDPTIAMAIHHRVGTLQPGDVSVVIASAAPHRDEAFRACREALEAIKENVPIWKAEERSDGEIWLGWGGG